VPNHNHPLSDYRTWQQLNTELERNYGFQWVVRKMDRITSDIQFLESLIQQEKMNGNSAFKNELELVQLWIDKLKNSETRNSYVIKSRFDCV
jgi:macrodomain Ter protein organizer (MatP/YcbG family)